MNGALVWFSISIAPRAKKHTSTVFEQPLPTVSQTLFSLSSPSTEIRCGLLKHSTSLLPLMSVCVPP